MQVIILAAGKSSRFYPYTQIPHKTFIALQGRTILEHTLESVKKVGLKEVILVTSGDPKIKETIKKNVRDLEITFVNQLEANGMGDALIRAKPYIKDDFFLLNASHIDFHEFAEAMIQQKTTENEVVLLAKKETDLTKFGVIRHEGDRVKEIIEKPEPGKEPSNLKVIGIYLLTKKFINTLESTNTHHYSLETAISNYAQDNPCTFTITENETVSLKYPWDLLGVNKYLGKQIQERKEKSVTIAQNAVIHGNVVLEEGVKIYEGACLKGPVYIGKNTIVGNNAIIRGNTMIAENCVIGANTEIKDSILLPGTKIHSGFIGDSVIGENCRIAAYFCTANRRLDRQEVKIKLRDKKIATGVSSLGVIMGDNVKVGIHSATMPGIIVGNNSIIGPSTTVNQNIEENTQFYTEFHRIIKKKKPIVLFDIDYTLFNTAHLKATNLLEFLLYDEVNEVIEQLAPKARLGILSEGEFAWQTRKLKETKIHEVFEIEHMHIVEKKFEVAETILKKYQESDKIFLVDDKLTFLYQAKQILPSICTIWVKRGEYAMNQKPIEGFTSDYTVNNLQEIIPLITNG
jgi:bifunctional UDP-N-acetylglucosamine pyrophosphorylase/glucosamine-1-phosphate N-acetyltransferase